MRSGNIPTCMICRDSMDEIDYFEVPIDVVAMSGNFTPGVNLLEGWFWCMKCNEYKHQPTIDWPAAAASGKGVSQAG